MPRLRLSAVVLLFIFVLFFAIGCTDDETENTDNAVTSQGTNQFSSDIATGWMDLARAQVKATGVSPPVAARIFGYAGVTLYESVVPGMPDYRTLAGQVNELTALPQPEYGQEYCWPEVANAAMATILYDLFADFSTANLQSITDLETSNETALAQQFSPEIMSRSMILGQLVGTAIFVWAQTDGYESLHNCAYTAPVGTGLWEPTPPGFGAALEPCWGNMRPFVLHNGSSCPALPHPAYSEADTSVFYTQAYEVYTTINNLSTEQTTIAQFWSDDPGLPGTPPGHSFSIATQVLRNGNYKLDVAAETYARVGMAVADAFITCWHTKYVYNLCRPVTYIQRLISATWMPPLNTPRFPEYTSGHSVQSAATADVLTDLFGEVSFDDHTHDSRGLTARHFDNFFAAANEAAISRLYGGIHYRAAIDNGLLQGICIGDQVNALQFRR